MEMGSERGRAGEGDARGVDHGGGEQEWVSWKVLEQMV